MSGHATTGTDGVAENATDNLAQVATYDARAVLLTLRVHEFVKDIERLAIDEHGERCALFSLFWLMVDVVADDAADDAADEGREEPTDDVVKRTLAFASVQQAFLRRFRCALAGA